MSESKLVRASDGVWTFVRADAESGNGHPAFVEALPRYLNALDPVFTRAEEASAFEFIMSLLRVRGLKGAGWDPFETTLDAIPAIMALHEKAETFEAARHLQLWVYGHILEASEPYELVANLLSVAGGGRFRIDCFPPSRRGVPQSPGQKIQQLKEMAKRVGLPEAVQPFEEAWDRELRNAVFHADYILNGSEVRIVTPPRTYTHDQTLTLVNRALARHRALAVLYDVAIRSYTEPTVIDVHPGFSNDPDQQAVVIVREGHGVVGLKSNWSAEQIRAGKIQFCLGHFFPDELRLLDADPTLSLLPPRQDEPRKPSAP